MHPFQTFILAHMRGWNIFARDNGRYPTYFLHKMCYYAIKVARYLFVPQLY